jgi:acetyl esterase/lipase
MRSARTIGLIAAGLALFLCLLVLNSATHISATAPPTLVIFGDNDHLVPPDATDVFVQRARSAGINIESVRFPYGEHAFNLNQYGIGNQLFLGLTERFLREHGQHGADSTPPRSNDAS